MINSRAVLQFMPPKNRLSKNNTVLQDTPFNLTVHLCTKHVTNRESAVLHLVTFSVIRE